MKTRIEVTNRREAQAIQRGLSDPQTRAFVIVVGTLLALPSDRARQRTLQFVTDYLDENARRVVSDV